MLKYNYFTGTENYLNEEQQEFIEAEELAIKALSDSWTPCSEPPTENGKYLCCDKNGDMNADTFHDGEWFTEAYCFLTTKWVAWRPLPDPWKGEEK